MKKIDNKGFMLVETLIVASFIAVILIYLFIQFRNVNNNYSKSIKYNSVNGMYIANQIKEYIKQYDLEEMAIKITHENKGYYEISNCSDEIFEDTSYCLELMRLGKVVHAIYMPDTKNVVSEEFSKDFIDFIKTIPEENKSYLIVVEFSDGSFASIKVTDKDVSSLENKIKEQMIYNLNSTNPGLYYDNTYNEDIKYVFKGSNPLELNNNIEVFGYKGKIVSIDDQGIKVILELKNNLIYDNSKSYFTSNSLIVSGSYDEFSNTNSMLFSSLNSKCDNCNSIVKNVKFDVGKIISVVGNNLNTIIQNEKNVQILTDNDNSFGTVNVSDIIRAAIGCNYQNITNTCLVNNWLNNDVWTMNYKNANEVWSVDNNAFVTTAVGNNIKQAYRIVYIDKNVLATGEGTEENPYKM